MQYPQIPTQVPGIQQPIQQVQVEPEVPAPVIDERKQRKIDQTKSKIDTLKKFLSGTIFLFKVNGALGVLASIGMFFGAKHIATRIVEGPPPRPEHGHHGPPPPPPMEKPVSRDEYNLYDDIKNCATICFVGCFIMHMLGRAAKFSVIQRNSTWMAGMVARKSRFVGLFMLFLAWCTTSYNHEIVTLTMKYHHKHSQNEQDHHDGMMKRHHQKSEKPHHGKHGRGLDGLDDIEAMSELLEQFVDGPMFDFEFKNMNTEADSKTCGKKSVDEDCNATPGCSWCTMQELPVGTCKTQEEAKKLAHYHKFTCSTDRIVDKVQDRFQEHMQSPPPFMAKFLPMERQYEEDVEDVEDEQEQKQKHYKSRFSRHMFRGKIMEMFCLAAVIAFPIALGIMLVFHCMVLHKIACFKRQLDELEGKKSGWGCGPCGGNWKKWKGKCGQKKAESVPAPANLETQSATSMSINSETPVTAYAPCEDKIDTPPVNNRGVTIHIQPHNSINANSNDMK